MSKPCGLHRSRRLRSARDFRRVYRGGRRCRGDNMVVVALPRREQGCRVGLSVSKAHGPAVRRNKIKRLLREAFRLERQDLIGDYDLILIPVERERYHLDELRNELARLVAKVPAKGKKRQPRRRT